jgi:hypothetical protein
VRKYLTPDQIRLREDLAGARDRIIVLLNLAVGESLRTEHAQEFVEKARAWSGPNAFRLLRYLASRPDALSAPRPDCPPCGVRLIALLIEAGHGAKVGLVPCADCGRTNPLPTYAGPEGRLCHGCSSRRLAVPCARCGKLSKAVARRPDGRICQVCKEKEPGSRKECVSCRRMMIPTRHLPDGTYLCQTCAPKKLQTCCRCGRWRRANALTADGPVCGPATRALPADAASASRWGPSGCGQKARLPTSATAATCGRRSSAPYAGGSVAATTSSTAMDLSTAMGASHARPASGSCTCAHCAARSGRWACSGR